MNKHKILICDDEEGVRKSLKLILSEKYDLEYCNDGAQAVDAVRGHDGLKAVLLDIKMPRKSGLDALKEIRSAKNSLPVIIITGYQSVETAREALKNGASDYIVKPFESATVLEALSKAL